MSDMKDCAGLMVELHSQGAQAELPKAQRGAERGAGRGAERGAKRGPRTSLVHGEGGSCVWKSGRSSSRPAPLHSTPKNVSDLVLTPWRCCSPAKRQEGTEPVGSGVSHERHAGSCGWQRAGGEGTSGLQQEMASEVDLRQLHLPAALHHSSGRS